jgi:hypothetical protein
MKRMYIEEALAGMPEQVCKDVLRATGPVRHAQRTERAWYVAWKAVREVAHIRGDGTPDSDAGARALLWLEHRLATEGEIAPPTTRLAPFRELGKGRRQAIDGQAWTAAIGAAVWCNSYWDKGDIALARCIELAGAIDAAGRHVLIVAVGYGPYGDRKKELDVEMDLGLESEDLKVIALFAAREAVRLERVALLQSAACVYERALIMSAPALAEAVVEEKQS